jgi:hypothetical protein
MGQDQGDRGNGFQTGQKGQEANKRGRKGGHECSGQSEMGKGQRHICNSQAGQEGLAQQSGGQGQTFSSGQGEMGEGQGGGQEDAVRLGTAADLDG